MDVVTEEPQIIISNESNNPLIESGNSNASGTGDQSIDSTFLYTYGILSELVLEGKLTPEKSEKYKDKLVKLQQGIQKAFQHDQELQVHANKLKEDLDQQKEKLKKSGTLSFSDNTQIGALKRDLIKAQTEATMCLERDELDQKEQLTLEQKRKLLGEEADAVRKKKEDELEPRIQTLTTTTQEMQAELLQQKVLIDKLQSEAEDIQGRISKITQTRSSIEEERAVLKAKLSKTKADPEKYRKQADVVQIAFHNLEEEARRHLDYLYELDRELTMQAKKKKDYLDESMDLALQLDKHRTAVEAKERQGDQVLRELETRKAEAQESVANRAQLDLELKAREFTVRRKGELLVAKQREVNLALKHLRRTRQSLEALQKSVPELQGMMSEMAREVDSWKNRTRKQNELLQDLRIDVDIVMNSYLTQEDLEKSVSETLSKLYVETKELETELSRLSIQEVALNSEIAALGVDREGRAHEAAKALGTMRDVKEELKMKDLVIYDLTKQLQEGEARLHQYEGIYEHVKSERNKYVSLIQTMHLAATELREKLKILQNEIDILRTESLTKNKALLRGRADLQRICNERDQYRNEINKNTYLYRKRQELLREEANELTKLNQVITTTELQMQSMRRQYESTVEDRNFTGIQLIDRNDELCILYEKSNVQDDVISSAVLELKRREDELRILRLTQQEVQREIDVMRKMTPDIPILKEEIQNYEAELQKERSVSKELIGRLEDPLYMERWRLLDGNDPDPVELQSRMTLLEKRINSKTEKVNKKQHALDEVLGMVLNLESELEEKKTGTISTLEKLREYKGKIKKTNRSLMGTVSELSLYRAAEMKLKQEVDDLENTLKEANIRLERGEPPTIEAQLAWQELEKRKEEKEEMKLATMEKELYLESLPVTLDGRPTMAIKRVDHYIPLSEEGELGIPKPYGNYAPFKPTEAGSTMRHIRKPKTQKIQLVESIN